MFPPPTKQARPMSMRLPNTSAQQQEVSNSRPLSGRFNPQGDLSHDYRLE
jgi:hypothetical protein